MISIDEGTNAAGQIKNVSHITGPDHNFRISTDIPGRDQVSLCLQRYKYGPIHISDGNRGPGAFQAGIKNTHYPEHLHFYPDDPAYLALGSKAGGNITSQHTDKMPLG